MVLSYRQPDDASIGSTRPQRPDKPLPRLGVHPPTLYHPFALAGSNRDLHRQLSHRSRARASPSDEVGWALKNGSLSGWPISSSLFNPSASAFINSQTSDDHGTESLRSTRRSKSATAPRDAVTRCIEERALRFQGFDTPPSHLEPLQLVRYHANETYDLHTDWFTSPTQTTRSYGGNRLTSFFAYVLASKDISGGGTTFPLLDAPKDERWCQYIDCDLPLDEGVTFLPIPGNAVFWVNLVGGRGDQRVIHSGSVVTSGEKVGLNIWTREGPLNPKLRGEVSEDQNYDDDDE